MLMCCINISPKIHVFLFRLVAFKCHQLKPEDLYKLVSSSSQLDRTKLLFTGAWLQYHALSFWAKALGFFTP